MAISAQITEAAGSLKMLNPIAPLRGLGKGTGTLAASFGIWLNPELGFTAHGNRPLGDVLREGLPDPETTGIFPEMRELHLRMNDYCINGRIQ